MNATSINSKNPTATSLMQIGVITRYTLLDYMRSRRFTIMLAIVLGLSTLMVVLLGNVTYLLVQISPFVALFSGIFFGSDAIAGKFQNKTGYFSIPNPIRRTSIYLGKWIAAFTASSIVSAIFTVITLSIGFYYGSIPQAFRVSVLFTWVFLAAARGCVFFLSSLSKSIMISIALDVMLLMWASMMIVRLCWPYSL